MDKVKFGFSKVIKKPNLLHGNGSAPPEPSKIEMITEISEKSIKLSRQEEVKEKLIIPMTTDQKSTPLSRLISNRKKNKSDTPTVEIKKEIPENETLEQQAARELIESLQVKEVKIETKIFEVPVSADELPLEGAKEPSLDDYDRVPISDFGKAMLRGMGWKEEEKKPENDDDKFLDGPVQRPKGMGLGADKVIKKQPLLIPPSQSETLEIKRNACVKILAGKHKNLYGTIEGFDEGGGRVIVKLAIGGLKVTFNEFMVQAISKQEFAKYAKILNSEKYEEYKSGDVKPSSNSSSKPTEVKEENNSKSSRNRLPERKRERSRDRDERDSSRNRDDCERSRHDEPDRSRHRDEPDRSRHRDEHKSSSKKSHKHRDRSPTNKSRHRDRSRSRSRGKHSRRRDRSSSPDDYKRKSHKHKKSSRKYSSSD